jgi:hypothetical protein
MKTKNLGIFGLLGCGLVIGMAATATQGCDPGDIAEQCGLVCDEMAFLEGKANISGTASIDAFFGASLDFSGATAKVSADIQAELDALYALVGVEAGGDFKAGLDAKLSAWIDVDAGLTVKAEPARCEANLDVSVKAAAECDVMAKPGMIEAKCEGSCAIDASAQADCSAMGGLTCKGTAPDLKCEGSCSGGCDLAVAAKCDGNCKGTCDGNESSGRCDGMCEGSCEVTAGAKCEGKCTGSCEYTPPSGMCDASAEAQCSASAEANIDCKGSCSGKATPPEVSAECKASVDAKAEASVQCFPPSVSISYTLNASAEGNLDAQAELEAFLGTFKLRFSALLAAVARAKGLVSVGGALGEGGLTAITDAAGQISADGDFKAKFGAACAIKMLPAAGQLVTGAVGELGGKVSAAASVTAAVGM